MNKLKYIFIIGLLPIIIGVLPSCPKDPVIDEYLIQIDSIKVPSNINTGIPFQIEFYGTISVMGCSGFSHFTVTRSGLEILIEVWKWVDVDAIACPAVIVYLDGEILDYQLNDPGSYLLKIKQPDKTFLTKSITVN
jgi:hypothetical protein